MADGSVAWCAMINCDSGYGSAFLDQDVQLVFKAAGGSAVYRKGPLDRCLRDILTMNQHVVATSRTYEMAGRMLLGLEPLRWLFRRKIF
jgi:hypothetical protein